jgi:hypothetical protein
MDPEQDIEVTVLDKNENPIVVGSRVLDDRLLPCGTVSKITTLFEHQDEHERPIGPMIHVDFDDGTTDSWPAYWSAKGPDDMDAPYVCENVTVAEWGGDA